MRRDGDLHEVTKTVPIGNRAAEGASASIGRRLCHHVDSYPFMFVAIASLSSPSLRLLRHIEDRYFHPA